MTLQTLQRLFMPPRFGGWGHVLLTSWHCFQTNNPSFCKKPLLFRLIPNSLSPSSIYLMVIPPHSEALVIYPNNPCWITNITLSQLFEILIIKGFFFYSTSATQFLQSLTLDLYQIDTTLKSLIYTLILLGFPAHLLKYPHCSCFQLHYATQCSEPLLSFPSISRSLSSVPSLYSLHSMSW